MRFLAVFLGLLVFSAAVLATASEPEDLPVLIAAAGTADDHENADQVVVLDRTTVEVEESGLAHINNRKVTKVLTEDGARDLVFQRFDYDPATQDIEVKNVVVHRADGTSEVVDLAGLVDVIAPAWAIYWGACMLGLDLPRLEVGDAVEIATYRKGFQIAYLGEEAADESKYIPPMRGHYYEVVFFQGNHPIIEKTYTLTTPRTMPVQFEVYNGEVASSHSYDDQSFTYVFRKENVPAAEHEWSSPDLSDYATKVVLATVQNWEEKSRWFCEVNEGQFDTTPEIDAKVAEITAGLRSDKDKIAAINHWVAQNIRYCGVNMGEGEGYTLHPGDMIFRERSGVCKDIAGMSITMLRAAGYEVYPAMTMAGARVEATPADQFNHCVVALRHDGGDWEMLDPTWVPYSRFNWSRAEGEQHYVIGSPEGEGLSAIRTYTAEENGVKMTIEAKLDVDGNLRGSLALRPRGYSDTRLRRTVGSNPKATIEPNLRRWLATLAPGAVVTEFKFGDPTDWDQDMTLDLEFEVPGFAGVGDGTLSWRPLGSRLVMANYSRMFGLARADLAEERQNPLLIWNTQQIEIHETVELPRGFAVAEAPADVTAGSATGSGFCDFQWQAEGRKLGLKGKVVAADRTVPPERWPDLRAAIESFTGLGDTWLLATKGGRS